MMTQEAAVVQDTTTGSIGAIGAPPSTTKTAMTTTSSTSTTSAEPHIVTPPQPAATSSLKRALVKSSMSPTSPNSFSSSAISSSHSHTTRSASNVGHGSESPGRAGLNLPSLQSPAGTGANETTTELSKDSPATITRASTTGSTRMGARRVSQALTALPSLKSARQIHMKKEPSKRVHVLDRHRSSESQGDKNQLEQNVEEEEEEEEEETPEAEEEKSGDSPHFTTSSNSADSKDSARDDSPLPPPRRANTVGARRVSQAINLLPLPRTSLMESMNFNLVKEPSKRVFASPSANFSDTSTNNSGSFLNDHTNGDDSSHNTDSPFHSQDFHMSIQNVALPKKSPLTKAIHDQLKSSTNSNSRNNSADNTPSNPRHTRRISVVSPQEMERAGISRTNTPDKKLLQQEPNGDMLVLVTSQPTPPTPVPPPLPYPIIPNHKFDSDSPPQQPTGIANASTPDHQQNYGHAKRVSTGTHDLSNKNHQNNNNSGGSHFRSATLSSIPAAKAKRLSKMITWNRGAVAGAGAGAGALASSTTTTPQPKAKQQQNLNNRQLPERSPNNSRTMTWNRSRNVPGRSMTPQPMTWNRKANNNTNNKVPPRNVPGRNVPGRSKTPQPMTWNRNNSNRQSITTAMLEEDAKIKRGLRTTNMAPTLDESYTATPTRTSSATKAMLEQEAKIKRGLRSPSMVMADDSYATTPTRTNSATAAMLEQDAKLKRGLRSPSLVMPDDLTATPRTSHTTSTMLEQDAKLKRGLRSPSILMGDESVGAHAVRNHQDSNNNMSYSQTNHVGDSDARVKAGLRRSNYSSMHSSNVPSMSSEHSNISSFCGQSHHTNNNNSNNNAFTTQSREFSLGQASHHSFAGETTTTTASSSANPLPPITASPGLRRASLLMHDASLNEDDAAAKFRAVGGMNRQNTNTNTRSNSTASTVSSRYRDPLIDTDYAAAAAAAAGRPGAYRESIVAPAPPSNSDNDDYHHRHLLLPSTNTPDEDVVEDLEPPPQRDSLQLERNDSLYKGGRNVLGRVATVTSAHPYEDSFTGLAGNSNHTDLGVEIVPPTQPERNQEVYLSTELPSVVADAPMAPMPLLHMDDLEVGTNSENMIVAAEVTRVDYPGTYDNRFENDAIRLTHNKRKKKICWTILVSVVLVAVVVIVALAVTMATGKSDSEQQQQVENENSPSLNDDSSSADADTTDRFAQMRRVFGDPVLELPAETLVAIQYGEGKDSRVKAFEWMLDDPSLFLYSLEQIKQRFALATLYFATNGPAWFDKATVAPNSDWMNYEKHECTWFSLAPAQGHLACASYNETTDSEPNLLDHHNVTALVLSGNDVWTIGTDVPNPVLTGNVPLELSMLSSLKILDLGVQKLKGTVPAELGDLPLTDIVLYDNSLTGTIPISIYSHARLLWLSYNKFDPSFIPPTVGSQMESLALTESQITGTIPTQLLSVGNLKELYLSANQITGTIPSEIGLVGASLQVLQLHGNVLSATLPTEIGLLTNLTAFSVQRNQFTGTIPTYVGLLTALTGLYLFGNQLSGNVPTELSLLSNLEELLLSSRQFPNANLNGTIPLMVEHDETAENLADFVAWPKMKGLWLASTHIDSTLPSQIQFMTNLQELRLGQDHQMSGTIPSEFGVLSMLVDLELATSNLTGAVPSELGLLTNLIYLRLQDNHLSGPLPVELANLTLNNTLEVFRVDGNPELTGTLPESFCSIDLLEFGCNDEFCGCDCPCVVPRGWQQNGYGTRR